MSLLQKTWYDRWTHLSILAGFVFFLTAPSIAQIALFGGRGLLRCQDAETVKRSDLYLGGFGSTFLVKSSSNGLAKDYHFSFNATYGLSDFLELSTRLVAYQDDQQHIWGPIGDMDLAIKLNVPIDQRHVFNLGLRNALLLPTGTSHNLPYEPFTSDHIGWSPGANFTLDLTNLFYFPMKFYLNGGYIDRYLRDELFTDKIDQAYLATGLKVSIKNLIIFWEYYTEQFLNRSEVRFSENYQVSTQGVAFLGPYNLIVTLASDVNLAQPSNQTFFKPKELADWKIWIGFSKYIPLRGYMSEVADRKRREKERMDELKKQQMIKQERLSAEEELKRMQDLLKKQQKEKKKE